MNGKRHGLSRQLGVNILDWSREEIFTYFYSLLAIRCDSKDALLLCPKGSAVRRNICLRSASHSPSRAAFALRLHMKASMLLFLVSESTQYSEAKAQQGLCEGQHCEGWAGTPLGRAAAFKESSLLDDEA